MWWHLGRWDTVDEMLAALDPSDLVWARAAYETVPLDDGWKQAGTIAAAVHNEFERYSAGKAGKRFVEKGSLRAPTDYIPQVRLKEFKEIRVNQASIDAYQQMIEQQYR